MLSKAKFNRNAKKQWNVGHAAKTKHCVCVQIKNEHLKDMKLVVDFF